MGFVKNLAKGGLFGLAGLAASKGSKKSKPIERAPSLLTQGSMSESSSMIGGTRGY